MADLNPPQDSPDPEGGLSPAYLDGLSASAGQENPASEPSQPIPPQPTELPPEAENTTLPITTEPLPDSSHQLDLYPKPAGPLPTDQTAQVTAQKFAFAQGQSDPAQAYASIVAGNQKEYQQNVATQTAIKADQQRIGIIQNYAQARSNAGVNTPLSDDELQTVEGLTQPQVYNPDIIMQQLYSNKVVSGLYPQGDSVRQDAANSNLNVTMHIQDAAEGQIALNEYANNMLQTMNDEQGKKGLVNQATDVVGQMIPFFSQINRHGATQGAQSAFWTSDDLQLQYAHIRGLPTLADQTSALEVAAKAIAGHNELDAINFVSGFIHYGTTDAALDTIINVGDIASAVSTVSGGLKSITSAAKEAQVSADAEAGAARVRAARAAATGAPTAEDMATVSAEKARINATHDAAIQNINPKAPPDIRDKLASTVEAQRKIDLDTLDAAVQEQTKAQMDEARFAAARFANASKDTIKAMATSNIPNAQNIAGASGRFDIAETDRAFQASKNSVNARDPVHLGADLRSSLPGGFNPATLLNLEEGSELSREDTQVILDTMKRNSVDFMKAASTDLGPSTISPEGLLKAVADARTLVGKELDHSHLSDTIIDSKFIHPEDTLGNVGLLQLRQGLPGGALFRDLEQAAAWAKAYGHPEPRIIKGDGPVFDIGKTVEGDPIVIKQQGQGYYIEITRAVDETRANPKDFLVETNNTTPKSSVNTLLDAIGGLKFRSPNERLSLEQQGLRESIMHRVVEVQRVAGLPWKRSISPLNKAERARINQFLDFMRREIGPDKRPGIVMKSLHEFQSTWMQFFNGRLPNVAETNAFYGYVASNQMQHFVDSLRVYADHARAGMAQWNYGRAGEWAEGKLVDTIPWDNSRANIELQRGGKSLKYNAGLFKDKAIRTEIDDLVKNEGYQIIQQADPRRLEGQAVHFIVSKTAKQKPLEMNLVPYHGDVRTVYDYPGYVKQAVVEKRADGYTTHYGDNTIVPVTTRAEGVQHVATLEKARELYNAGDVAGFKKFVDSHPPFNSDNLFEKFKNGSLQRDTPFVYTRAGESTYHTDAMQHALGDAKLAESWANSSLNPLHGGDQDVLRGRNLDVSSIASGSGIANLTDEASPMMEFVKPRMIDPLTTLQHGLNASIRNKFFNAYQIRTAEHFVEEFKNVLRVGQGSGASSAGLRALRENPMRVLYNPDWVTNPENRSMLAAARGYQNAAVNLLGTTTDTTRWVQSIEAKLMDMVFNKFGTDAANYAYEKVLPKISSPVKFARQVAFHTKLGFFNPMQLFLHAQTSSIAIGVLGLKHGMAGVAGFTLARLLHLSDTPENLEHFAKIASKFGWKADDFKDAYRRMVDQGLFNVGSNLAFHYDAADVGIVKKGLATFLDKGEGPMREGIRTHQLVGYMGTYHEWRAAHPFEALTPEIHRTQIMRRYGDVSVNMTHASSSAMNRGMLAVTGQFFSFQKGVFELMVGHRLSAAEKLRVFAVTSALYGIPSGITAYTFGLDQPILQGLGAAGVPLPTDAKVGNAYDDLRAWALQNGAQNNLLVDSIIQGLPSLMVKAATGGQEYNIGERISPSSGGPWNDIASGETVPEFFLGASGSLGGAIFRASVPVLMDLSDIIAGKGVSSLNVPDIISLMTAGGGISALSQGMRAYYALNYGKYFNTIGQVVSDKMNGTDALFLGLGFTPTEINDKFIMDEALKAQTEAQSYAKSQIEKYVRLWSQATDDSVRKDYADRINGWVIGSGFNPQELGSMAAEAISSDRAATVDVSRQKFEKSNPGSIEGTP